MLWLSLLAQAKEAPLVAIVLYQGQSGPAYVQLSDFLLAGKREVYVCGGQPLTNSEYHKLAKTKLAAGMVLRRENSPAIGISQLSEFPCVLPANLKLDRQYTTKELADKATVSGTPVSKSSNAGTDVPTVFLANMEIYLVAEADTELAEYLRASEAKSIPLLTDYTRQFPSSSHIGPARTLLAQLIVGQGEAAVGAYRQSVSAGERKYDSLKLARERERQALQVVPGFVPAEKLRAGVDGELDGVLAAARSEVDAFDKAMSERTPGFEHLGTAQKWLDAALSVDLSYRNITPLETAVATRRNSVENALAAAETLLAAKRYDEAAAAIDKYRHFEKELPRIGAVLDATFQYHHERAEQAVTGGNLEAGIGEYKRALAFRSDPGTSAALKATEEKLSAQRDQAAAEAAIEDAQALAKEKRFVEAYETLSGLPPKRRALVTQEMASLQSDYVDDLQARAKTLSRVHVPIHGRVDEQNVRKAYDYLSSAAKLVDRPAITVNMDVLGDEIGRYYLAQAKRLLEKPMASGVGMGVLLLRQAERFKPDDQEIKNQIMKYSPQFDVRAKLSVAARFRDQTSRRDSPGFADQLTQTVESGLEKSELPGIKVHARSEEGAEDTAESALAPNLRIVGDIVQHQVDKKVETERLKSHYRAGQREVKTPQWEELKKQVDLAQDSYDQANDAFRTGLQSMSKKDRDLALKNLQDLAAKLAEAKKALAAVPETRLQDILVEYNYTRRKLELTTTVEISFRIDDTMSTVRGKMDTVTVALPKTVTVLENVKPEDSDGVVEEGTLPDDAQLLREAESEAQRLLVQKILEQLAGVPGQVLEQARTLASRNDIDSAAEKYVLYLNSTTVKDSTERSEAQRYLNEQYDVDLSAGS
jgi:hypothetical protein